MSYIVPKEKPKCFNCPFRTLDYCGLLTEHDSVTVNVNEMSVSDYCPLVEIPTPHGRLIDADKLIEELKECADAANSNWEYEKVMGYSNAIESVEDATTIIETEGSEK